MYWTPGKKSMSAQTFIHLFLDYHPNITKILFRRTSVRASEIAGRFFIVVFTLRTFFTSRGIRRMGVNELNLHNNLPVNGSGLENHLREGEAGKLFARINSINRFNRTDSIYLVQNAGDAMIFAVMRARGRFRIAGALN